MENLKNQKNQDNKPFYFGNEQFIKQNPWPTTEEFIECADRHLKIELTKNESQRSSLYFLVNAFRDFLREDPEENNQSFWIYEKFDGKFPLKTAPGFHETFLRKKVIWANAIIDMNYKHEHFVVLFFIACLRYVKFPPPVRQYKCARSKGRFQLADLFLFNRDSIPNPNLGQTADFALQINILTASDVTSTGKLRCESYRSADHISKHRITKEDVVKNIIDLSKSRIFGITKLFEPKTLAVLVHINPYKGLWKGLGLYDENVRPEKLILKSNPSNQPYLSISMYDDDGDDDSEVQNENEDGDEEKYDHLISLEESQSLLSTQSQTQPLLKSKSHSNNKLKDKNKRIKEVYRETPSESLCFSQASSPLREGSQISLSLQHILENLSDSSRAEEGSLMSHNQEKLPLEVPSHEEPDHFTGEGVKRLKDFKIRS